MSAVPGPAGSVSYEAAYPRCFMLAMRAAWRITGDQSTSEDLAAEAMARAFARWESLKGLTYVEAWVQRVAINLAIDEGRRQRSRRWQESPNMGDMPDATARVDLLMALRHLSRRQREAVALHHLLDMPVKLVAEQLGISEGAVSSHLHRGVEKLRSILDVEGVDRV